jgi:DNA-binding SARP family transcriptional activator/DNA-binding CsgD family transcriptional regulator
VGDDRLPGTGLRAGLLGPVRVVLDGEDIQLGPARQRAVFAVLALRAGHPVSRAELVEAVWGPLDPRSAANVVHPHISTLRKALGANRDVLASTGNGYVLRIAPESVDALAFEQLSGRAAALAAAGQYRGAATAFEEALALWRGDAFAGAPGPLLEQERARLEEARMCAVEGFAAVRLELGAHVELAAELGTLVRDHPLREALHELLMRALAQGGRHVEALEVFAEARATLRRELGTEPGEALRDLHSRILAGETRSADVPLSVLPEQVAAAAQIRSRLFVGRANEVSVLSERVRGAIAGEGAAVWIEGDPGIGKSELLIEAFAGVERLGCQLGWAVADEPDAHFPLRLIMDCLDIDPKSADPERAELARTLRSHPGADDYDPVAAAVDRMLMLVDRMCAQGPLVLVLDDLQWADEASVGVARRLAAATRQLPLLLVACARRGHGRPELDQLRARAGLSIALEPLSAKETESLTGHVVGGRPGRLLRRVTDRAGGNPLYLREMLGALVRDEAVELVDGVAHIDQEQYEAAPQSLIAAIERTCGALPRHTHEVLRWIAVLGSSASVADIAAVTGRALPDLRAALADAVAANVIFDQDSFLAFRHPLLREVILGGIPAGVRAVLHQESAKMLAAGGAHPTEVAEQLVAAGPEVQPWVPGWLAEHVQVVASTAPLIAADLLERVLATGDQDREVLLAALVRVLFRLTRNPEVQARQALAMSTDPVRTEELRQLLAAIIYRDGRRAESIRTLTSAPPTNGEVPEEWLVRRKLLLAHLVRDVTDVDQAEISAKGAYAEAVRDGDAYLIAHALQTRWLVESIRRDHESALRFVDAAIDQVRGNAEQAGMHFNLLDNKLFTLQNLDRIAEGDATLRAANELVAAHKLPVGPQVSAAVHYYWTGRWDEALLELETITEDGPAITYAGLMDAGPTGLLLHGVSALVAAHRGDAAALAANLDAAERYLLTTDSERESCDFLLAARCVAARQRGDLAGALREMAPVLDPAYAEMMLRHQWLPHVLRLALDLGDEESVRDAMAVAELEAARERVPARAYAALNRCQALVTGDPRPALVAVEHYRAVGRPVELAYASEDAAALLIARDRRDEAIAAYAQAAYLFATLDAQWDLTRAEERIAQLGLSDAVQAEMQVLVRESGELTAHEQRIAEMVASGLTNPEIAVRMGLPRRIVQAHVAQIMTKLGVGSRAQVRRAG